MKPLRNRDVPSARHVRPGRSTRCIPVRSAWTSSSVATAPTDRTAFIDDHGRLRQEDIPVDRSVGHVERVEPIRPAADPQGAGEPVVQLPADPLHGEKPDRRRPARPGRQPEERLHPGEHPEPVMFVPQADACLTQILVARTRLKAVALGHLDEVGGPGTRLGQPKAVRRRVPSDSGLPAPGPLRPGRLDPLHRDVHSLHQPFARSPVLRPEPIFRTVRTVRTVLTGLLLRKAVLPTVPAPPP